MVSIVVLTVGLFSLVGVAAVAVARSGQSSPMLIAREKAREAIESVHTARDTGELAWSRIQNVGQGNGSFLGGDQPRSEEHTSELQSPDHLGCRLLPEK